VICEADFRKEAIQEGKCPICLKQHPDAKDKLEAMSKNQVPNRMGDELDEMRVREIVGDAINPLMEKLDAFLSDPPVAKGLPEAKKRPGRPKKETN
jgi:hypothetical protein